MVHVETVKLIQKLKPKPNVDLINVLIEKFSWKMDHVPTVLHTQEVRTKELKVMEGFVKQTDVMIEKRSWRVVLAVSVKDNSGYLTIRKSAKKSFCTDI